MAQAGSSAQREPSMEEILASIRRIIEDSDAANVVPAGKRADAAEHADGDSSGSSEETDAAAEQSPGEMAKDVTAEAQESVLPGNSPADSHVDQRSEASGATEQASHGSGSLADVLREVTAGQVATAPVDAALPGADDVDMDAADEEVQSFREELSDTDEDGSETGVPDEREYETSGDDSSMNALSMADIQAQVSRQAEPEEAPDSAEEEQTFAAAPADDAGSADEDETADDEDYAAETGAEYQENSGGIDNTFTAARMDVSETRTAGSSAVAVDRPAAGNQFAARAPIISEMPGRQVAAAFDELSEAFSHTKKFDEMAEEMMRPMLQDWLDNNLPMLVERLVREEIDRVARGVSR